MGISSEKNVKKIVLKMKKTMIKKAKEEKKVKIFDFLNKIKLDSFYKVKFKTQVGNEIKAVYSGNSFNIFNNKNIFSTFFKNDNLELYINDEICIKYNDSFRNKRYKEYDELKEYDLFLTQEILNHLEKIK